MRHERDRSVIPEIPLNELFESCFCHLLLSLLKVPVDDAAYGSHVYKAGASSVTLRPSL